MPTLLRRWTVADLGLLADYLARERFGHAFVAPADTVFSERRAVQPDVFDARTFERSTPDDPRVEVMAERLAGHPSGAREPLELDLTGYFARVLNA